MYLTYHIQTKKILRPSATNRKDNLLIYRNIHSIILNTYKTHIINQFPVGLQKIACISEIFRNLAS